MTTLSRNAPCHCGSGKKYKACHLPQEEALRKPQRDEDALLILQPTRGAVCHETLLSLDLNVGIRHRRITRVARKPVDIARNELASHALEAIRRGDLFDFTPRETYVLWVDDDAWLPPGLIPSMMRCMSEPSQAAIDALFGWFCTRKPHAPPAAWRRLGDPNSYPRLGVDCQFGELVPIEMAGFHCVLMRSRLLERLGPDPFTVEPGYSEDMIFCKRAMDIGAILAVGTGFPVAHVDPRDGMAYMVGQSALIMQGNELKDFSSMQHVGADGALKTAERREYGIEGGDAFEHVGQRDADIQAELELRRKLTEGVA